MRIEGHLEIKDRAKWENFWRALSKLGDLGNLELEKVADAGRRAVSQNFEREAAPDGTPWHPLAPLTQKIRRQGIDERGVPFRVAGAHPILVRTKDLRQSFENPDHPRNITEIRRLPGSIRITLGAKDDPKTPNRIATLHAGGTTPEGNRVPARPFIGMSRDAEERVDDTARYVIDERVKRLP